MAEYEPASPEEIVIVLAAFYSGQPVPSGFAVNMSWNPRVRKIISDPPGPAPAWPGPYFSAFDARLDALMETVLGQVHLPIQRGEDFIFAVDYRNVDGSQFDLTGYGSTFAIHAHGDPDGDPVIALTEGDGVETGPGTLDGDPYNVLVTMLAVDVDALPDFGVGSYQLEATNGVDSPVTIAAHTAEVTS